MESTIIPYVYPHYPNAIDDEYSLYLKTIQIQGENQRKYPFTTQEKHLEKMVELGLLKEKELESYRRFNKELLAREKELQKNE